MSAVTQITTKTLLSPAISAWRIYLEDQGRSKYTVKAFIGDLNLLLSFLPPDHSIGAVTTTELNSFLEWLKTGRGVPCSPKTLSRRITSLKSFFRWLATHEAILVDPAEKLLQKSVISPLPNILIGDQITQVIEIADQDRLGEKPDARASLLLRLLLDTGIKKGELLTLTTNHIDLEAPEGPILFVRYASPQHRYKERKISLTDGWLETYDEYQGQYDTSEQLFPWSPRRLEYLLEDIGKAAALPFQLSFIICRWSCALRDYQAGIDPNNIRQKLGVSEIQFREIKMKLRRLDQKSGTDEQAEPTKDEQ